MGLDPKPPKTGIVHQADFMTITVRIMRPKGAFGITVFLHLIEDSFKLYERFEAICKKFGYNDLTTYYIQPVDDYHYAFIEMDIIYDQSQKSELKLAETLLLEINKEFTLDKIGLNYYEIVCGGPGKFSGPKLGSYYDLLKKFKYMLDLNNIMNPDVYLPE
jgi:hypothetical protein